MSTAQKQTRVAMRLPTELVKAVDGYAKSQTAETGVKYTRTDAMRALLAKAFEYLKRGK